jgi:hypothetical protein
MGWTGGFRASRSLKSALRGDIVSYIRLLSDSKAATSLAFRKTTSVPTDLNPWRIIDDRLLWHLVPSD